MGKEVLTACTTQSNSVCSRRLLMWLCVQGWEPDGWLSRTNPEQTSRISEAPALTATPFPYVIQSNVRNLLHPEFGSTALPINT